MCRLFPKALFISLTGKLKNECELNLARKESWNQERKTNILPWSVFIYDSHRVKKGCFPVRRAVKEEAVWARMWVCSLLPGK